MIISDEHRLAFIHIPKCAGVSVKQPLRAFDSTGGYYSRIGEHPELGRIHFAHIPLGDLALHFPEDFRKVRDYRSFAVVRDPRARFLSAIFQRLREFKQLAQSQITAGRVAEEADEVMARIEAAPERLGLELVHFNRQADFVNHAGTRIVGDLFAIEHIGDLVDFVSEQTGVRIEKASKNRSTELRSSGLRAFARAVRPHYAALVPYKARARIRARFEKAGLYRAANAAALLPPDGRAEGFVRAYYAADFALHAESLT